MTDNFKALVVIELSYVKDYSNPLWAHKGPFWSPQEDYTLVNPEHVMIIRSCRKFVLYDLAEGPAEMFTYEIHFSNDKILNCIVDDRDTFFSSLTS